MHGIDRCGAAQECTYIRVLEDDGDGRQVVEAEETVEFAFLHMHKTLRTRLLVTLVRHLPTIRGACPEQATPQGSSRAGHVTGCT